LYGISVKSVEDKRSRTIALGVIVVTHNSAAVVRDCMESITTFLPRASVCVADNDSTDATVDAVLEVCPTATVLPTGGNLGYARACNLAFAHLERDRPDVVLVVNPDVVLRSGSEEGVLAAFADPAVTHATGLSVNTLLPLVCRAAPDWYELLRYSLITVKPGWFPIKTLLRPMMNRWPAFASGALLAVRAQAWRDTGGFDEDFFLYREDRDFGERLLARGPMAVIDDLRVEHALGTSSAGAPTAFSMRAALSGWLLYVAKAQGKEAARSWCARTAATQRALAAFLAPTSRLGFTKTGRKRERLLIASTFLRNALNGSNAQDDEPSRVLLHALNWVV
jgi:N-acetylglucosaminyl-diphospho-decaprenol L-rhamnosyltransferase